MSAAQDPKSGGPAGLGTTYGPDSPHTVKSVEAFTFTPAASSFLLGTAKTAIAAEGLGTDPVPDLLVLSLSSFDYAGHAYGPYSAEMLDHVVQMDRALADFLQFLDKGAKIEGGLSSVVFAVTADHGVSPAPEDAIAYGLPGGRVDEEKVRTAVENTLRIRFGDMPCGWIAGKGKGFLLSEGWIYLNEDAVRFALSSGKAKSRAEIERAVVEALRTTLLPGIYRAFAADDLLNGADESDMARRVSRGVHPTVSGDIAVIQEPMFQFGETSAKYVTSHGTPYLYDAHVPLLIAGPGIEAGVYSDPVEIVDLAPTIAALLGIEPPSGADGHLLRAALR